MTTNHSTHDCLHKTSQNIAGSANGTPHCIIAIERNQLTDLAEQLGRTEVERDTYMRLAKKGHEMHGDIMNALPYFEGAYDALADVHPELADRLYKGLQCLRGEQAVDTHDWKRETSQSWYTASNLGWVRSIGNDSDPAFRMWYRPSLFTQWIPVNKNDCQPDHRASALDAMAEVESKLKQLAARRAA